MSTTDVESGGIIAVRPDVGIIPESVDTLVISHKISKGTLSFLSGLSGLYGGYNILGWLGGAGSWTANSFVNSTGLMTSNFSWHKCKSWRFAFGSVILLSPFMDVERDFV